MPTTITRQFASPAEAAEYLGVEVRNVYSYITSGRLPATRLSHRAIRIRISDLEAWVESRRIVTVQKPA